MPRLQCKSFATPDQVRAFPRGRIDLIQLDEITIGRFALQPGFCWEKDVAPVVRTSSCLRRHLGYAISGSLQVTMDDGTVLVIERGDGYQIPPGHKIRVIGSEPWKSLEFASAHTFGLTPEELGERVLATVLFSDIVDSSHDGLGVLLTPVLVLDAVASGDRGHLGLPSLLPTRQRDVS